MTALLRRGLTTSRLLLDSVAPILFAAVGAAAVALVIHLRTDLEYRWPEAVHLF